MLSKAETLRQLRAAAQGKTRLKGLLNGVVIEKAYMNEKDSIYIFPKNYGIFFRAEPLETFGTDDLKQIIKHIEEHGIN